MIITCEYCNFHCNTYEGWFAHLMTMGHQSKALPVSAWTEEMINRSIYIEPAKAPTHINFSEREVWVRYFRQFGTITEIVLPDNFKFIIIQFDIFKIIENVLNKKPHYVRCVELRVHGLWTRTEKERQGSSDDSVNHRNLIQIPTTDIPHQAGPSSSSAPVGGKKESASYAGITRQTIPTPAPRNMKTPTTPDKKGGGRLSTPVTANPFLTISPPQVQKLNAKPFTTNSSESQHKGHNPGLTGNKSLQNVKSLPELIDLTLSTVGAEQHIQIQLPKVKPFSEKTLHVISPPLTTSSMMTQQSSSKSTSIGDGTSAAGTQNQPNTSNNQAHLGFDQILKDLAQTKKSQKPRSNSSPVKNNTGEIDPLINRHEYMRKHFQNLILDEQHKYFLIETTLTEHEGVVRENFLYELSQIIRSTYPSSLLHPFGSYLTGLADFDSDIDIYVDSAGTSFNEDKIPVPLTTDQKLNILGVLRNTLRRSRRFSQVIGVPNARVPIIKLVHGPTAVKADLSFENLMSVQNSRLIKFYTNVDPHVRPLLILVRYWARYHGVTGTNYVKNYGLVLMALVFLTRKRFIPPVYMLQDLAPTPKTCLINGWNTAFCQNQDFAMNSAIVQDWRRPALFHENGIARVLPNAWDHLALAQEFFTTFGNFDYENQVICSLMGDFLPRASFRDGAAEKELPIQLNRYKAWLSSPAEQRPIGQPNTDRGFDTESPLCIQDPFNLSFNVCGCTRTAILARFKEGCSSAAAELGKLLAKESNNLMSIFVPMPQEKKMKRRDRIMAEEIEAFEKKLGPARANRGEGEPSNPKLFIDPAATFTDIIKLNPSGNFEFLVQSLVKEGVAPKEFMEDLADRHWLNLMAQFLKTVFQQVYQLEVEIEDYSTFNNKNWPEQERRVKNDQGSNSKEQKQGSGNDNPEPRSAEAEEVVSESNSPSTSDIMIKEERKSPEMDIKPLALARGRGRGRGRIAKRPFTSSPTEMSENGNGDGDRDGKTDRGNGRGRGHGYKLMKSTSPSPPTAMVVKLEAEEDNKTDDEKMDTSLDLESGQSESTSISESKDDPKPVEVEGTESESRPHYLFVLHCTGTFPVFENRKNYRKAAIKAGHAQESQMKMEEEVTNLLIKRCFPNGKPTTPIFKFDIGVSSYHMKERSWSRAKPVFSLIYTDVREKDPLKYNLKALYFLSNGHLLSSMSAPYIHHNFSKWFEENGRKYIAEALGQQDKSEADNSSSS